MKQEEEKHDFRNLVPITNNPLLQIRIISPRVDYYLGKEKNDSTKETLAFLDVEIDYEILRISNWINKNEITDLAWFEKLKSEAKQLVSKQITIQKLLPKDAIERKKKLNDFYYPIDEKWLQLKNPIKNANSTQHQEFLKFIYDQISYDFYCEVGALFAQDFIRQERIDNEFYFFFKDKKFDKKSHLDKYIKESILKTTRSVRQYIADTLNETGIKNIYFSKNKMVKIVEYCKSENLMVSDKFNAKLKNLLSKN